MAWPAWRSGPCSALLGRRAARERGVLEPEVRPWSETIDRVAAGGSSGSAGSAPLVRRVAIDLLKEQAVAEIRKSVRSGNWEEARSRLTTSPAIIRATRGSRRSTRRSRRPRTGARDDQHGPARGGSEGQRPRSGSRDPQVPGSASRIRGAASLEADLSRWFLRLIHNRLRTGRIQADLAHLAGRIAESFSHTVDGASLHASLPTLRRSAGLCPRCASPTPGSPTPARRALARSSAGHSPRPMRPRVEELDELVQTSRWGLRCEELRRARSRPAKSDAADPALWQPLPCLPRGLRADTDQDFVKCLSLTR